MFVVDRLKVAFSNLVSSTNLTDILLFNRKYSKFVGFKWLLPNWRGTYSAIRT